MKDILVVMGSHPKTRGEFDWTREDCDIVVFNEAMKMDWVKRADYVTQMHLPVIWRNPGNRNDPNHYNWLKSGNTPIILMQEKYEDVPNAMRFPIEDVLKIGRKYLTSSAAYCIAFGIVKGYQKIEVYGVAMETNTEYEHQRPGVAYWVGVADGCGVELDFHGDLLTCPLYGYEGDIKFPYSFFDERLKELAPTAKKAADAYNNAREESNKLVEKYLNTGEGQKELVTILQKTAELAALFGLEDGAAQEILRYKKKADIQIEATGEHLFSKQEFEYAATTFMKDREKAKETATNLANRCQSQFEAVRMTTNKAKRKNRMNILIDYATKFIQESVKVGVFDGAAKENILLMKKLDEMVRMAGGEASKEILEAVIENRA